MDDDSRHAPDGYYIVVWTSEPYTLQDETDEYVAGTLVCRGVYHNWVRGASRWYTAPTGEPEESVFRVRTVVDPSVDMEGLSDAARLPNSWRPSRKQQVQALQPMRVTVDSHEEICAEIARRALLDYEEDLTAEADAAGEDSDADDEASVEDNDSGSSEDEAE